MCSSASPYRIVFLDEIEYDSDAKIPIDDVELNEDLRHESFRPPVTDKPGKSIPLNHNFDLHGECNRSHSMHHNNCDNNSSIHEQVSDKRQCNNIWCNQLVRITGYLGIIDRYRQCCTLIDKSNMIYIDISICDVTVDVKEGDICQFLGEFRCQSEDIQKKVFET